MTVRRPQHENPCFTHSKSVASNGVWVRLPPSVLQKTRNKGFAKRDPSRANPAEGQLLANLLAKRPKIESIDHIGRGRRSVASTLGR